MSEENFRNAVASIMENPLAFAQEVMKHQTRQEVREWIKQHYQLTDREMLVIAKEPLGYFGRLPFHMERIIEADRHWKQSS